MKKGICNKCNTETSVAFGLNRWFCADCATTALIDKDIALKASQNNKLTDLNLLAKRCYIIAEDSGFFTKETEVLANPNLSTEEKNAIFSAFSSQILMHISSEISEIFGAMRNGDNADVESFVLFEFENDEKFLLAFRELIKNTIQGEVCDAIIILLGFAHKLGIDLDRQIEWGLKHNKIRHKIEGSCNGKKF